LLSIFRNNLFINSLLLLPYVILVRIHTLIYPVSYEVQSGDTFVGEFFFSTIISPLSQSVFAIVLVYLQAVFLNRIVIKHRLAPDFSLWPGLIYILLTLMPSFPGLSPHLIANTFILISIDQLFRTYKNPKVADNIFNAGLWIGVSSLFVPNHIYLILIAYVALLVLRSAKLNELIQLVAGLFVCYFLTFGGMYLCDKSIATEVASLSMSPHLTFLGISGIGLYKLLILTGVALFAVASYSKYTMKKTIQAQKKIDILFWIMAGSGLLLLMTNNIQPYQTLLFFIPLAIFLNTTLFNIKNTMIQELLHLAALALGFALGFGWIPF